MKIEFTETDSIDGVERKWFTLTGIDNGTDYEFDNDEYAICSDGTILNCDGCALESESDYQTIAVRNALDNYEISKAAAALGRKGGQAKTEAKQRASRENGKKGGRPKKSL